jgi:hypothetical protein
MVLGRSTIATFPKKQILFKELFHHGYNLTKEMQQSRLFAVALARNDGMVSMLQPRIVIESLACH